MSKNKKTDILIDIIKDFFNNYDIYTEDIDEITECVCIIAGELIPISTINPEEIRILVEKKIIVKPPIYSPIQIKNITQQIANLKTIKQPEQRSEEWYTFRNNRLTASDLGTAMGSNIYGNRKTLVANKCGYKQDFKPGAAILHGIKYESMATLFYEKLHDVKVYEYGCIPHSTITYFAASPDGIVDSNSNNTNYIGRMLEIKCPKSRELNGYIPNNYELQIQGQLEVCNLEYCDYLECDIKECDETVFFNLPNDTFKGIIFEYYDNNLKLNKHIYKKDHLDEDSVKLWAHDKLNEILYDSNYEYIGLSYWYINNYDIILVKRDKKRFDEVIKPKIDIFWNDVLEYRKKGYEELVEKKYKKPTNTKIKHNFIVDSD